ncbi:AMP-dependent synthetase [Ferrigenium kumadai]|uniref:AMP-dependent synthetase n=1 Tax=Ferrigenium kumadai TaxID=1682490 RepID=A0AAN1SYR3_9PROT|nr:long-chain fatty acid--CoA ligase [Ferrigenium kumadai]BBI99121.1 AMP-dependent synthetase [Ferrigenium kumadai]
MQAQQDDVITPQQAVTLHGLFLERVRRTPDKIAYRHFQQNAWRDLTWREMRSQVARWQAALAGLGLQRGDRVAIMLRNCPYWMMFDQAAMSLGLVVVPLYTVDRPDNIAYIVNDAGVKVLLFETAEQWQALRTVRDKLGSVLRFISIDSIRNNNDHSLQSMAEFLPPAAQLLRAQLGNPDELASIIYTSGTTGKPKGVMLSHANMLSNAHACLDTFTVHSNDLFLSFLPLSHTFERTLGYYLAVMTGTTVAFARSIPLLSEDLKTIRPTLIISVPRIYERIYGAIRARLEDGSSLRRSLFHLAVETGWARFEHAQGRGPWKVSFLLWPLLQKLVAQKVLDRLGGRLRSAISGGAALAPEISRVFIGLGLPIVQGYGLTETSPVISGNCKGMNFPDSVGQPIRDVQVRLGEQSELLVKGPNVMLGYWNNPEATRAMIDADGWLNTGDVAHIADTGHIYITGRTKEIIVMSNGEKIPPTDMEIAILHDPLFDQVMIFGEAHPYLVALAVVNPQGWEHFAQEVGIRADMPEALTDSRVEAKVLKRIARNLRDFPGYAKVNRVLLLREPWSIENGLLTPTLKIKRAEVAQRFATEIRELYDGH